MKLSTIFLYTLGATALVLSPSVSGEDSPSPYKYVATEEEREQILRRIMNDPNLPAGIKPTDELGSWRAELGKGKAEAGPNGEDFIDLYELKMTHMNELKARMAERRVPIAQRPGLLPNARGQNQFDINYKRPTFNRGDGEPEGGSSVEGPKGLIQNKEDLIQYLNANGMGRQAAELNSRPERARRVPGN